MVASGLITTGRSDTGARVKPSTLVAMHAASNRVGIIMAK